MSRAPLIRTLFIVGPVVLCWACAPSGDSPPPFPVETQTEWEQYLQGTWVYAGASSAESGIGAPVDDSLFFQITFRGDTLDYLGETHQGARIGKREATCVVGYGEPYELEVASCVRGLNVRVMEGDTIQSNRFSVSPESPQSKKMAYFIGTMFPPSMRAHSRDSLWMMERQGTKYYLTREQRPE